MSEIKELIERLYPDGVEYRKLADLAEVGTGSSNKQDSSDDGKYPFFVRSKFVERHNNFEYDEEAIIIPGEGGIGDIFHYINGKYALHQRVYRIHFTTNSVNTKFAYYYLRNSFKKYILGKAVSATVTSIRKPMIQNFEIPVPPIEVQRKIVEILDNFTELEAELERKLEAELEARRKQYEYYRNQLLSFDKVGGARFDVKWMTLGEMCSILDSKRKPVTKNNRSAGIYPYYGASGIVDYVANYIFDGDYLLISEDGANLEMRTMPIAFSISGKNWVNNHAHILKFEDITTQKYVQYYIEHMDITTYLSKGSMPKLTQGQLKSMLIPVPPLEEQKRIVSILDRFEALTTDLQSGLPAEIEARRKQYEYYREKLLTFKRKTA